MCWLYNDMTITLFVHIFMYSKVLFQFWRPLLSTTMKAGNKSWKLMLEFVLFLHPTTPWTIHFLDCKFSGEKNTMVNRLFNVFCMQKIHTRLFFTFGYVSVCRLWTPPIFCTSSKLFMNVQDLKCLCHRPIIKECLHIPIKNHWTRKKNKL